MKSPAKPTIDQHREQRLSAFDRHAITLATDAPMRSVEVLFAKEQALPGVIVLDAAGFVSGVISRQRFNDMMGRPFGRSLLARRTVGELLAAIKGKALLIPEMTPVSAAAEQALARGTGGASEPIVCVAADGTVGLIEVVDLLRAQNAELRAAVAEGRIQRDTAEIANRKKAELLTTLSSKICDPLASIEACAEGCSEGEAANLQRECRSLSRILGDIFDYSTLEAGMLAIDTRDVDVVALVEGCVSNARAAATEAPVITVTYDLPIAKVIATDSTRLAQLLSSLLANAVTFTHGRAVDVCVGVSWNASRNPGLIVDVSDSGPGLPADRDVFDAFVQGDTPGAGTGLGLTLARSLARLLGGDVIASKRAVGGTVFRASVDAGGVARSALIEDVEDLPEPARSTQRNR